MAGVAGSRLREHLARLVLTQHPKRPVKSSGKYIMRSPRAVLLALYRRATLIFLAVHGPDINISVLLKQVAVLAPVEQ
ncbi:hypothetical protein LPB140_03580 [Sphingorhabdus lutea]|uniref:Uncharacterized protein n=1 Tax=Sphingorhabdus lutea TaxID=1913578 RepID=A0A1L3JA93_9SPHN|nr:hypothetical protein LPB140_03580 [Sphingorhabdus lutea]